MPVEDACNSICLVVLVTHSIQDSTATCSCSSSVSGTVADELADSRASCTSTGRRPDPKIMRSMLRWVVRSVRRGSAASAQLEAPRITTR
eukprot:1795999-Pyramimonas_sp.AAC.1